jgi:hypothetical protein
MIKPLAIKLVIRIDLYVRNDKKDKANEYSKWNRRLINKRESCRY